MQCVQVALGSAGGDIAPLVGWRAEQVGEERDDLAFIRLGAAGGDTVGPWVADFLSSCVLSNRRVSPLTQWSIAGIDLMETGLQANKHPEFGSYPKYTERI